MGWRAGDLVIKDFGFKQSKRIRSLERKLWAQEADIKYDHETDTHARSGEFDNLLQQDLKNIKNEADGKEIFASPDEEYFTVYFFFGSEDEIVAKLEKLLAKQKQSNKDAKFTDTLDKELADKLGTLFADVPKSGATFTDRRWIDAYSNGKHTPDYCYFERNDGWILCFRLGDKTVSAHHCDITVSDGGKYSKERVLNTVGEVEAFIKKLGPDIPKRPPTFSEAREEELYQILKPVMGGDFEHKRGQGYVYFGPCYLTRERAGKDAGRLYLSIGNLNFYGGDLEVGYIKDADLKKNIVAGLAKHKERVTKKIEEELKSISQLQESHVCADKLLERLGAR